MIDHPVAKVIFYLVYALWVICKYTAIFVFHAIRIYFKIVMAIVRAFSGCQTPYQYEEPPDDPPYREYRYSWDKRPHKDDY